jgi:hypothetical protein
MRLNNRGKQLAACLTLLHSFQILVQYFHRWGNILCFLYLYFLLWRACPICSSLGFLKVSRKPANARAGHRQAVNQLLHCNSQTTKPATTNYTHHQSHANRLGHVRKYGFYPCTSFRFYAGAASCLWFHINVISYK